ncbi:hypothetical protein AOQ84DRAFT_357290 [Glonium stellatum]|uniref:Uncharacterized protein n=1 Tax=Glonium stellatum TaxID=574774 RepID=A0A8E2JMX1_9PEZI|nr:hypothetical protein AOQ84DRAFT_357290 [Glonium stellatum]
MLAMRCAQGCTAPPQCSHADRPTQPQPATEDGPETDFPFLFGARGLSPIKFRNLWASFSAFSGS